jgi:hypothetical protein
LKSNAGEQVTKQDAMRHQIDLCKRIARTNKVAASVVWLAALLATAGDAQSQQAPGPLHRIGEIGGNGGGSFEAFCGSNAVVIGFNMRSGTALDAINPICIRLNPEGTEWSGQAYEASLQYRGGPGGGYQKIACNPGDAVRHFHVYAGPWGNSIVVKHVRMTCQDLGSGHWYNVVPQHMAGTVSMEQRFSCGDGEWAAGLYGRTGALVDKLGFACKKIIQTASLPPPAPAAPPPPPAPDTCTVLRDSDIFVTPGGQQVPNLILRAGTPEVNRLGMDGANWFRLKWPAGEGWAYSGPGYPDAIRCP